MFLVPPYVTEDFGSLFFKDASGNYYFPSHRESIAVSITDAEMVSALETFQSRFKKAMIVTWLMLVASVVLFCFRAGTATLAGWELLAFPATWLTQSYLVRWAWQSSLQPLTERLDDHCRELTLDADAAPIEALGNYGVQRTRTSASRRQVWWRTKRDY